MGNLVEAVSKFCLAQSDAPPVVLPIVIAGDVIPHALFFTIDQHLDLTLETVVASDPRSPNKGWPMLPNTPFVRGTCPKRKTMQRIDTNERAYLFNGTFGHTADCRLI